MGIVSGRTWLKSPLTRFLKPSRMPTTSSPWLIGLTIVTELITPLIPWEQAPPTTMPNFPGAA